MLFKLRDGPYSRAALDPHRVAIRRASLPTVRGLRAFIFRFRGGHGRRRRRDSFHLCLEAVKRRNFWNDRLPLNILSRQRFEIGSSPRLNHVKRPVEFLPGNRRSALAPWLRVISHRKCAQTFQKVGPRPHVVCQVDRASLKRITQRNCPLESRRELGCFRITDRLVGHSPPPFLANPPMSWPPTGGVPRFRLAWLGGSVSVYAQNVTGRECFSPARGASAGCGPDATSWL